MSCSRWLSAMASLALAAAGCAPADEDKAPQLTPAHAALDNPKSPDFNRDGNADILWMDASTGQSVYWALSGTQYTNWSGFIDQAGNSVNPGVGWFVVGTGDINRDGHADIVWHNRSTGQIRYWIMQGNRRIATYVLGHVIGRPSYLSAVADVNNDNVPDLIWHNRVLYPESPVLTVWYMNALQPGDTTITRSRWGYIYQDPTSSNTLSSPFAITAAGDFDRDGVPDLVVIDRGIKRLIVWHLRYSAANGRAYYSTSYLPNWINDQPSPSVDHPWYASATADYNNDGQLDVMLHNRSTGEVQLWLLQINTTIAHNYRLMQIVSLSPRAAAPWYAGMTDCEGYNQLASARTLCPTP